MSENNEGQEPETGGKTFDEAYVAKLRQEAADYRIKLRNAEKTVEELKPLATEAQALKDAQKSEAEKLNEKIVEMQRDLAAKDAALAATAARQKFLNMAQKANVPIERAELLDMGQFDLDDEEAAIKALSMFAEKQHGNGGGASSPARGDAITLDKLSKLGPDAINALWQSDPARIQEALKG